MKFYLSFLIHLPLLIFLAVQLRKRYSGEPLTGFFYPALGLKLSAGILLGLLYTFYYPYGDTKYLFECSEFLSAMLIESPVNFVQYLLKVQTYHPDQFGMNLYEEPRVLFFAAITSPLTILTLNNYWVSALYLSFFSFMGLWKFANCLVKHYSIPTLNAAIAFLFFPSVVFWSAGFSKEALVIGCIGFLLVIFSGSIRKGSLMNSSKIFLILLLSLIIWKIKFFYGIVLLPLLIAGTIVIKLRGKFSFLTGTYKEAGCFLALLILFTLLGSFLHPVMNPQVFLAHLYQNYKVTLLVSEGRNIIGFSEFQPDLWSLIRNAPAALVAGLFRPFIWESSLNISLLAGLENLFLLLLTAGFIFRKEITVLSQYKIFIVAALVYVFTLAIFLAIASPNLGTLARYKVGFMPFFLLLLMRENPVIEGIRKVVQKKKLIPEA